MASLTFKKIVDNLSSQKSVQNLVQDFKKLSTELKSKANKIDFSKSKNKTINQAVSKYRDIIKTLNNSQAKIDSEVHKAMNLIKKSAADVEKNILIYKKMALNKRAELEKAITKKAPSKSNMKKKVSKKTSRKVIKK